MAATHRHEQELKAKCKKAAQTATDPLELLRIKCLARGASGIKGIGRYIYKARTPGVSLSIASTFSLAEVFTCYLATVLL